MITTGGQIRRGREMIGLSQADLAEAAGVGLAVVVRAELETLMPQLTRKDTAAIQGALQAGGIAFVHEDGGPGLRLRDVGRGREASLP